MKLFLRRIAPLLLLAASTLLSAGLHAQTVLKPGDLAITAFNLFDDNANGTTQNDAFSFVTLVDLQPNTSVFFTDIGLKSGGATFQISNDPNYGTQSDGIIEWKSGATLIKAGTQIVVFCKYAPSASKGTVSLTQPTYNTISAPQKQYISIGLAGDQLIAYTKISNQVKIIAGVAVNRTDWDASLDDELTASSSVKPATSATDVAFPVITAINGKYDNSVIAGTPHSLRAYLQDPARWRQDQTQISPAPAGFQLPGATPANLVVVNPDANHIVYVDNKAGMNGDGSSWTSAYPDLRNALVAAAASNGDIKQIWVAKGTHKPTATGDRTLSFPLAANVEVFGGFDGENDPALRKLDINQTILSGDIDDNDNTAAADLTGITGNNSYHVVTAIGVNNRTVLDGFVITCGLADGGTTLSRVGAGLITNGNNTSFSLKLRNIHFRYNKTFLTDGGACYTSGNGGVTILNSAFYNNSSSFVKYSDNNDTLINVTSTGNRSTSINYNNNSVTGGIIIYNSLITESIYKGGANSPSAMLRYSIVNNRYFNGSGVSDGTVITSAFPNAATFNYAPDINIPKSVFNAGDPQTNNPGAVQAGARDITGQLRISNTIIDLGAYEYQAQPQTITLGSNPFTITYGDTDKDPQVTASSPLQYAQVTKLADTTGGKFTGIKAGTTNVTVTAIRSNKFLPLTASLMLNVVKHPLTVTVKPETIHYGEAFPSWIPEYAGFVFSDTKDVVRGTPVFNPDPAGSPGQYNITMTQGSLDADNYSFNLQPGNYNIIKQLQTVKFVNPDTTVTYGAAPFPLKGFTTSGLPVTYTLDAQYAALAAVSGNTLTIKGAGDIVLKASQPGDVNYEAAPEVSYTVHISKAVLNITADDKTQTYGDPVPPALTWSATGFKYTDNAAGSLTGEPVLSIVNQDTQAGNYTIAITAGTLAADNYTFNFQQGTLTINKRTQAINSPAAFNKTYGDAPFDPGYNSTSGLPVKYTITSGPAAVNPDGNIVITGAGNITFTVSQAGDGNTLPATTVTGSFTAAKAILRIIAEDKSMNPGNAFPAFTYRLDGFVGSDGPGDISSLNVTYSHNAPNNNTPGSYIISITNATYTSGKYLLNYEAGTLIINKKTQYINVPLGGTVRYGTDIGFSASNNSGLPLTYTVTGDGAMNADNTAIITGNVGNITVTVNQAGNSEYLPAQTQVTFTVAPAPLTIVPVNVIRPYNTDNPTFSFQVLGLKRNDQPDVLKTPPVFTTVAVKTSAPGYYPIVYQNGSTSADNYTVSGSQGTLQVVKATHQITGAAGIQAKYGDAPYTLNAVSSEGFPVTYTIKSGAGNGNITGNTFTITHAGTVVITASAAGDANYADAAPVDFTVQIDKAILEVKADDKSKQFNTANPALTWSYSGFVYTDNAVVLTGIPAISTTADLNSPVGTYPIALTQGSLAAADYTFSFKPGILTVGKGNQTISFPAISNHVYGDAPFTISATATSGLTPVLSVTSGNATISNNVVTITGTGNVTITAAQAGDNSYNAAPDVSHTFTVTPAALTITAKDDSRTYTGNAYTGGNGVTYTGLVYGEQPAVLNGPISYTGNAQGAVNAGSYDIIPAGLSSANYAITFVKGTLVIGKATQQITQAVDVTKQYGDAPFTLTAASSKGFPVVYTIKSGAANAGISGSTFTIRHAGDVTVTASAAGDANHEAATPVDFLVHISKAPLEVKADDKSKQFNTANPALTWSYSGFVYSDDATVITGAAAISTTADLNSPVGTYPIALTQGSLAAADYTFSFKPGILTVGKGNQTISFPAISNHVYGDAPFTISATATSGLTPVLSVTSGNATISNNVVTITGTGNVTITAAQSGDNSYNAAPDVSQTFTVTPAALTITAKDDNRTYTGNAYTGGNGVTYTGLVYGEQPAVLNGPLSYTGNAQGAVNAGSYDIIPAGLSSANYAITFVKGTLVIGKATQQITQAVDVTKQYGDAPFTLTAASSKGFPVVYTIKSGAANAGISGSTFTIKHAGDVTVTASAAGDANNEAASPVDFIVHISKAPLEVKADDKSKQFNTANPALTWSYSGFVYSDDATAITGAAVISTTADLNSPVGTYPIALTQGSLAAADYTFSFKPGILTVGKGNQTISFPAISNHVYGGAPFTISATATSGLTPVLSVTSGNATISNNVVTITGTGNVTIIAAQAGDNSYNAAPDVSHTFTVAPAALTITAKDDNRTYTGNAYTGGNGVSYTGLVYGEQPAVLNGPLSYTGNAQGAVNAGSYDIMPAGLSSANYAITFVKGILVIGKATQQITQAVDVSKQYGDAPFTLTAASSKGFPVVYTIKSGAANAGISGSTFTITHAGDVTVTASAAGDANNEAASPVDFIVHISKATLTVKADDKSRLVNTANPLLTWAYSGFVYTDNAAVLTGTPAISTTADINSPVGTYPVTVAQGSLAAADYTFHFQPGTLTVGKGNQTISFPAISNHVYGDAPFTISATATSGLTPVLTVTSGKATVSNNVVTITGTGSITITADQPGNSSYNAAPAVTQTFTVTPAALTVKAKDDSQGYTGNAYTGGNGVTYTGLVYGEQAAVLSGTLAYGGSSQGAVNAGSYIIMPSGLSSANYTITYQQGTLVIGKATQQITYTAVSNKNQGDPDFTISASASSGLPVAIASNNSAVISLTGATAKVGIAGIATITITQPGNSNYNAAPPVTFDIHVSNWPAPVITPESSVTFCEGGKVTLTSTPANAYQWYRNGVAVNGARSRQYDAKESGSYSVTVTFENGYQLSTSSIAVTVTPVPSGSVRANGNTTISKGDALTLIASGGASYKWQPANGLSSTNTAVTICRPAETTTYEVVISNGNGCSVTRSIVIIVKEDYKLEAVNVLTPNGDGINDRWIVKNIDMYPQNEVKIFDRAGRLLFRQKSYSNTWDGTVNGQPLAEGTYYFAIDMGTGAPLFKGFITIIR
ncbi:MBG domain-containing protein [Chitinophaga solisilvae]|uniref:MBG domain-containing protein n=1 Tax=Chitinophaga solisilvae TaxID=1233460 RepID=UPI00137000B9|nr:MBG domain-containing protein [Chitinophaga solisilvae]